MLRSLLRVSTLAAALLAIFAVAAAGVSLAQAQVQQSSPTAPGEGAYTIFDTPQATLLLDQKSGNLWRIGYTEVAGQRFWFGTYVPRQPPLSFTEFQNRLRKEIRTAPRER